MSAPENQEQEGRRETEEIWWKAPLKRECVFTAAPPLIVNTELESAVQVTRMLSVPGLAFKQQGGEKGEEAGGMIASAFTLSPEDPRLGKCLIRTSPFSFTSSGLGLSSVRLAGTFVVFWFSDPQTLSRSTTSWGACLNTRAGPRPQSS